jgi:hypothetical protein
MPELGSGFYHCVRNLFFHKVLACHEKNSKVERLNGTKRNREVVMRGLNNAYAAQELPDAISPDILGAEVALIKVKRQAGMVKAETKDSRNVCCSLGNSSQQN